MLTRDGIFVFWNALQVFLLSKGLCGYIIAFIERFYGHVKYWRMGGVWLILAHGFTWRAKTHRTRPWVGLGELMFN